MKASEVVSVLKVEVVHLKIDPVPELGDIGVNTWHAIESALHTPRHETSLIVVVNLTGHWTHKRGSTITLGNKYI